MSLAQVDTSSYQVERPSLEQLLAVNSPFVAYTYSYPHKTAYRPLPPRPLDQVWAEEKRDALFLYFHVPFCESRCGYCNLFSQAHPDPELPRRYLATLERQAQRLQHRVGELGFARVAIGGGTPTQLDVDLLERLFDLAERGLGAPLADLPVSLETSPATATQEKLTLARERGVDRVSIGVQSFVDPELTALCRHQDSALAHAALDRIRAGGFATLNIDLIYGIHGQTEASWQQTIDAALRYHPEELYLYPLYLRPLTELGRQRGGWADSRLVLYRAGRDQLLAAGYQQISMRMFRRTDAQQGDAPVYACQEDGMIGLGCGARSYTRSLHYSDEWAVGARGVHQILTRWVERPDSDFEAAWYGYDLDAVDQRARYLLKSLFRTEGIDLNAYRQHLGGEALVDNPQLTDLLRLDLVCQSGDRLLPTKRGLELSDCLGPWLYSDRVRQLMGSFDLR